VSAHTPGPWRKTAGLVVSSSTGQVVAITAGDGVVRFHGGETDDANARLIAAAPALLRGCQAALAYLAAPPSRYPGNRDEAVRIIEAAIAAASGG